MREITLELFILNYKLNLNYLFCLHFQNSKILGQWINPLKISISMTARSKPEYSAFRSAVSKINSDINPDLKIEDEAADFLALHLYTLAKNIVNSVSKSGKSSLGHTDVIKVLPDFLEDEVLRYARAEGVRQIVLHTEGIKVFIPKKSKPCGATAVRPTEEMECVEFSDMLENGIRTLVECITNTTALNRCQESLQKINEIISSVANFLVTDVCELSKKERLEEIDDTVISRALERCLPSNLLYHADHAGNRNVVKYVNGELIYESSELPVRKATAKKITKISVPSVKKRKDKKSPKRLVKKISKTVPQTRRRKSERKSVKKIPKTVPQTRRRQSKRKSVKKITKKYSPIKRKQILKKPPRKIPDAAVPRKKRKRTKDSAKKTTEKTVAVKRKKRRKISKRPVKKISKTVSQIRRRKSKRTSVKKITKKYSPIKRKKILKKPPKKISDVAAPRKKRKRTKDTIKKTTEKTVAVKRKKRRKSSKRPVKEISKTVSKIRRRKSTKKSVKKITKRYSPIKRKKILKKSTKKVPGVTAPRKKRKRTKDSEKSVALKRRKGAKSPWKSVKKMKKSTAPIKMRKKTEVSAARVRRRKSTRTSVTKTKEDIVDFKKEILILFDTKYHKQSVDDIGIEIINSFLSAVCRRLVRECTTKCSPSIATIKAAVERCLPPALARHALAYGAQVLQSSTVIVPL